MHLTVTEDQNIVSSNATSGEATAEKGLGMVQRDRFLYVPPLRIVLLKSSVRHDSVRHMSFLLRLLPTDKNAVAWQCTCGVCNN